MGWLWMLVIGAAAFAILWLAGVSRQLATISGAALLFGASGYAWQQHASLAGHPVRADAATIEVDPGLVAFRSAIMPSKSGGDAVLAAADERLRNGDSTGATQMILDAIDKQPGDPLLWAGLGSVVAAHDGGQVSPTAAFAFRRAMALAPNEPGPHFFLGLALVQSRQLAEGKEQLLRALALAPHDAAYRLNIAETLVMIDRFEAKSAGTAPTRQPGSR